LNLLYKAIKADGFVFSSRAAQLHLNKKRAIAAGIPLHESLKAGFFLSSAENKKSRKIR